MPSPKKDRCIRGHTLAETRDAHGNCRECARIRNPRYANYEQLRRAARTRAVEQLIEAHRQEFERLILKEVGLDVD